MPSDAPVNGTNETMTSPVLFPGSNQVIESSSNSEQTNPDENERIILKKDLATYGLTINYAGAQGLFKSRLPKGIAK